MGQARLARRLGLPDVCRGVARLGDGGLEPAATATAGSARRSPVRRGLTEAETTPGTFFSASRRAPRRGAGHARDVARLEQNGRACGVALMAIPSMRELSSLPCPWLRSIVGMSSLVDRKPPGSVRSLTLRLDIPTVGTSTMRRTVFKPYRSPRMIAFEVNDMTCGHCVGTITQAVKACRQGDRGRIEIDLARHRVEIEPADGAGAGRRDQRCGLHPGSGVAADGRGRRLPLASACRVLQPRKARHDASQTRALLRPECRAASAPTHTLSPDEARKLYRERRAFTQPAPPSSARCASCRPRGRTAHPAAP